MSTDVKRYKHSQRDTEANALSGLKRRELRHAADTKRLVSKLEDGTAIYEGGYTTRYLERYNSLASALTAFGSSDIEAAIATPLTLSGNTTIPSNVKLRFRKGGSINFNGFTLTINGPLEAPISQIFSGSGTVTFSRSVLPNDVYAQWWGAKGDNSTDCAAAFNSAITCVYSSGGGRLRVPSGEYRVSTNIRLKRRVDVIGDSRAYFYPTSNSIKVFDTDGAIINDEFTFSHISIQNPLGKTGITGVYADQARHNVVFQHVYCSDLDQGMVFTNLCWQTTARECYVYGGSIGFEVTNSSHNFVFDRCTAYNCTQYGFYAHAEVTDTEPILYKTQFIGCLSQGHDLYGFYLKTTGYTTIFGGYSEANDEADIYASGCQALHVDGHYGGSNFGKTHIRLRTCDGARLDNICCPGVRTCQLTGTATIGSPTLTGMSDTSGFPVGATGFTITGFTGTCTVVSKTSSTVTFDQNSAATGTATITATSWTFDVDSTNAYIEGSLLRSASNNLLTGSTTGLHLQENNNGSLRVGNIGHLSTKIYGVINTIADATKHYHGLTNNRFDKNDVSGTTSPFSVDCRTAYDVQRKSVRGGEVINLTNPEDGQVMYFILRGTADMGDRPPAVKIGAVGVEYNISMLGAAANQNTVVALEYDGDYGWIVLADTGWYQFGNRACDAEGLRLRSGSAAPSTGTWKKGDLSHNNAISTTNGIHGWKCTQSGTFGTFTATCNTTNGSAVLSNVSSFTNLHRGDFITISAGFAASTYAQVLSFDSVALTITVDSNATSSQVGVTAAHTAPLFEQFGRTFDKDVSRTSASVGSTNIILSENTDNTNTASGAKFHAKVGGSSGGNAWSHYENPGVQGYSSGLNNLKTNRPYELAAAGTLANSTTNTLFEVYPASSGGMQMKVRFQNAKQSASVVAASDITLGNDGSVVLLSGTTTVNRIATANWQSGATVRLLVPATGVVAHNGVATGGGFARVLMNTAANFTAPALGGVLTLTFDGTDWRGNG